jgi:hypothetical protein
MHSTIRYFDMKYAKRFLLMVVPVYFIFWTIGYLIFVGSDFKYFLSYLHLTWTNP